jgi:hypothetical protein
MKYMFLLYGEENTWAAMSDPERDAVLAQHGRLAAELEAAGKKVGGEELAPGHTATTLRLDGSEAVITDGPFAESREQLGGFYVFECADLDEALAWARKIPMLGGAIEIRPVVAHTARG